MQWLPDQLKVFQFRLALHQLQLAHPVLSAIALQVMQNLPILPRLAERSTFLYLCHDTLQQAAPNIEK